MHCIVGVKHNQILSNRRVIFWVRRYIIQKPSKKIQMKGERSKTLHQIRNLTSSKAKIFLLSISTRLNHFNFSRKKHDAAVFCINVTREFLDLTNKKYHALMSSVQLCPTAAKQKTPGAFFFYSAGFRCFSKSVGLL